MQWTRKAPQWYYLLNCTYVQSLPLVNIANKDSLTLVVLAQTLVHTTIPKSLHYDMWKQWSSSSPLWCDKQCGNRKTRQERLKRRNKYQIEQEDSKKVLKKGLWNFSINHAMNSSCACPTYDTDTSIFKPCGEKSVCSISTTTPHPALHYDYIMHAVVLW